MLTEDNAAQHLEYAQRGCLHLTKWTRQQPDRSPDADMMAGVLWLSTSLASGIMLGQLSLSSIEKVLGLIRGTTMSLLEEAGERMDDSQQES
jgi:hypothetical protein